MVEWAVKMTRLPDAATLRARLSRGEVTAEPRGGDWPAGWPGSMPPPIGAARSPPVPLRVGRPERPGEPRPGGAPGGRHARPTEARPARSLSERSCDGLRDIIERRAARRSRATPTGTSDWSMSTGSRTASRRAIGSSSIASSSTSDSATPIRSPTSPSSPWSWPPGPSATLPARSSDAYLRAAGDAEGRANSCRSIGRTAPRCAARSRA